MKRYVLLTVLALLCSTAVTAQGSANIAIDKIRTEPVPLRTGEYADLWLRVKNNGSTVAEDAVVEFVETFPFSTDPDEKTRWAVGELLPGTTYHIHLTVRVDENAVSGTNQVTFRTSAGSDGNSITKTVPVEVRTDDAALIVEDIQFPDAVAPGTTNQMRVTLRNLADSSLKNIDINLDLSDDDLPFATADTTRKRVQTIASGAAATASFTLYIDEGADNGVYKTPIDISYEDEAGTGFSRSEMTGIVVGGDPILDVGVQERDLMAGGSAGRVTLRIVNRGAGSARFVTLSVPDAERYEVVSSDTIYLGDMDSDDFQTAEFNLYAEAGAENLTIPVTLRYRDRSGAEQTLVQQVSFPLYDGSELRRFGLAQQRSPWILVVVVIVLAAAGFYWWRRR